MTKTQWQAFTSLMNPSLIDKWMGLPQGTPDEYVQAWRDAYKKAYNDPELQKIFRKEFSKDLTFISGKRVEQMISEVSGVSKEAVDYSIDMVDYSIDMKIKYGLAAQR